jgi:acetate kinase
MKILVLNPGSNSLKFQVIETEPGGGAWGQKRIQGVIEPVDTGANFNATDGEGRSLVNRKLPVSGHAEAAGHILAEFASQVSLIACRVVHGGSRFRSPVRVDEAVIAGIEELDDLAPLHNANSVAILRACAQQAPALPAIAVFDSAFHATLPEIAYRYAIPYELAERHGIRRFGFHGISHRYLMTRYAELRGLSSLEGTKLVTLHLEGGSSATAIRDGQSVDTSMGFTPLEGLMMGTRCGDIDPALIEFLVRKEGVPIDTVAHWLNKESGLLGVSGRSQDTRVLIQHQDARTQLALDIFCYRVRKYIGAYAAAMGGLDAVIFGGGIGENTPEVRRRVCTGLEWMGLELDSKLSAETVDREACLTRPESRVLAYVIPTEEGLMMAREAAAAAR